MAIRIIIESSTRQGDVGLRLRPPLDPYRLSRSGKPSGRSDTREGRQGTRASDHMRRVLGHFIHQVAVDKLDPIVVQKTRDLLILLDREAV
jgi:hypothetical protein